MLYESISSNPSKPNKSINGKNIKRRNEQIQAKQSNISFHTLITEFYYDSEEINAKRKNRTFLPSQASVVIRNFKPFEFEKSLLMADVPLLKPNTANVLQQTEGFVTCKNYNESALKTEFFQATNHQKNKKIPFIITESELLSCCHQAEKQLENDIPKQPTSALLMDHKKTCNNNDMLLVNSILEDFSQSPLREEHIIVNTSWEYTPEFRLRKRPVKNYSRKFLNSTKANLSQRFKESHTRDVIEYGDDQSSSSSLSIQEDATLAKDVSIVSTESNTRHLCANLLNLTEYYTQNQSQQTLSNVLDVQETHSQEHVSLLQNVPDLIDDILASRSIYHNTHNSFNSLHDFHGFSRDFYAMDVGNDEQPLENKNLRTSHDDILHVSANDKSVLNNGSSYDDFRGINAEYLVQQNVLNNSHENLISIRCVGFKTASSKPIDVSREAHIMAAKILCKLPDIPSVEGNIHLNNCDKKVPNEDKNIFKNIEDCEWSDDCDLFLNFQTPFTVKENSVTKLPESISQHDVCGTSKDTALGVKTAGGKDLHISMKAQQLFNDIENDYENQEDLRQSKLNKNYLKLEPSLLRDIKQLNADLEIQMAKGSQQKFAQDMGIKKNKINKNNLEIKKVTSLEIRPHENTDTKIAKKVPEFFTLQIDSNNEFNVNKEFETKKVAFTKNSDEDYCYPVDKFTNSHKTDTDREQSISERVNPLNMNMGFQTANGSNVFISTKTKEKVRNLLKEFETISGNENYENDLRELKMKIQIKNKNLGSKSVKEDNGHVSIAFNKRTSAIVCNTPNLVRKAENDKRKYSTDSSDLESHNTIPPVKMFKNGLHTTKSLFAEESLKSPLASATQSLILRKNLLSLTKRRKYKRKSLSITTEETPEISKELCVININTETPIKSSVSLKSAEKTPATPNLKEFYSNAAVASTPRIPTIEDSDFKPISWNNGNDSISNKSRNSARTTKLSDTPTSNITLNSSNPTIKERIGRLKIYGKATAISPIIIESNDNCRPSGLRRTRSMIKKSDL